MTRVLVQFRIIIREEKNRSIPDLRSVDYGILKYREIYATRKEYTYAGADGRDGGFYCGHFSRSFLWIK